MYVYVCRAQRLARLVSAATFSLGGLSFSGRFRSGWRCAVGVPGDKKSAASRKIRANESFVCKSQALCGSNAHPRQQRMNGSASKPSTTAVPDVDRRIWCSRPQSERLRGNKRSGLPARLNLHLRSMTGWYFAIKPLEIRRNM